MPVQDILAHTTNCNAQKGSNDMLCKAQFECATEYEPRRGCAACLSLVTLSVVFSGPLVNKVNSMTCA